MSRGLKHNRLTARQRQVVVLKLAGKSTREIAAELGLCVSVVLAHFRYGRIALGVRSDDLGVLAEALRKHDGAAADLETGIRLAEAISGMEAR